MKRILMGMATLIALTFASCDPEELIVYTVSFDTQNEQVVDFQEVEDGTLAEAPVVELEKQDSLFVHWLLDNSQFDFTTPITENITLVAMWERDPSVDFTEVAYQTISVDDFNSWTSGEMKLVKATINKNGNFGMGAWGMEVYLVDSEGNSSKDFYSHSSYGMFSFPIELGANDLDETYVFKVYKDVYMSSPQLGFGGLKDDCYNGVKWTTEFAYGVDYFDEVIRGTVKELGYSSQHGVRIITVKDTINFPELSSSDIEMVTDFRDQNVYLNCIKKDGIWVSMLDHSGAVQVSQNLGGTGNPTKTIVEGGSGTDADPYISLATYGDWATNDVVYIKAMAKKLGNWGNEFFLECKDGSTTKEILPNNNVYGMFSYSGIENYFDVEKIFKVQKGSNGQLTVKEILNA